jgi:hypothetical protein
MKELGPKQALAVRCPTCGSAPGICCQTSAYLPRLSPTLAREIAALPAKQPLGSICLGLALKLISCDGLALGVPLNPLTEAFPSLARGPDLQGVGVWPWPLLDSTS